MASTGFVVAGQGRAVNRTGGTTAWSNPGNITADDGSNATVSMTFVGSTVQSHWLVADTFDFSSIPDGSTIDGVQVRAQLSVNTASGTVYDAVVIGESDASLGTPKAPGTALTTTPTNYDQGSSSDLWGLTLSAADVKASTFQARIAVEASAFFSARTFSCDAIWVNVHYTPGVIEGTASITEASDTVASSAKIAIAATASITEAGDTLSSASALAIAAEADITEADDTVSATGVHVTIGSADITEEDDTLSATGVLPIVGLADITEEDDTSTATATVFTKRLWHGSDGDMGQNYQYWEEHWRKLHENQPRDPLYAPVEVEHQPVALNLMTDAERALMRGVQIRLTAKTIIEASTRRTAAPVPPPTDDDDDDDEVQLMLAVLL
jgi:hypothetical protein